MKWRWWDNELFERLPDKDKVSAFTVAELGEMLPRGLNSGTLKSTALIAGNSGGYGWLYYRNPLIPENAHLKNDIVGDGTEADARAKMLIYLVENKLISL